MKRFDYLALLGILMVSCAKSNSPAGDGPAAPSDNPGQEILQAVPIRLSSPEKQVAWSAIEFGKKVFLHLLLIVVCELRSILHDLRLESVDKLLRLHTLLRSKLLNGHNLFCLQLFSLDHILAFYQAQLNEIEIAEMDNQANKNQYACPHHKFGARVGFRL